MRMYRRPDGPEYITLSSSDEHIEEPMRKRPKIQLQQSERARRSSSVSSLDACDRDFSSRNPVFQSKDDNFPDAYEPRSPHFDDSEKEQEKTLEEDGNPYKCRIESPAAAFANIHMTGADDPARTLWKELLESCAVAADALKKRLKPLYAMAILSSSKHGVLIPTIFQSPDEETRFVCQLIPATQLIAMEPVLVIQLQERLEKPLLGEFIKKEAIRLHAILAKLQKRKRKKTRRNG